MTNTVNPDYYNKHSVTIGNVTVHPIDLIEDVNFDLGNIFKYLVRYQDKGKVEDLKKALTYLEHYNQRQKTLEDKCYKQAAKKLLLSQLSQENELLAHFIDYSSWENGDPYLGPDKTGAVGYFSRGNTYDQFHKYLSDAILNKEKGLQLFSMDDFNLFSRHMLNFSNFVSGLMEVAEKVASNKQSSHLHQVDLNKKDFEWFEGCVRRISQDALTNKTHINTYHYDGDSEFVLKYIRDVWLACFFNVLLAWPKKDAVEIGVFFCFFNVLLAWPKKDAVEIGVFLTESLDTNAEMLNDNNTVLFDPAAMKANCRVCEKIIEDIREHDSDDPLINLFYSYEGIFHIDFFKCILKVLFSEENAIAMD